MDRLLPPLAFALAVLPLSAACGDEAGGDSPRPARSSSSATAAAREVLVEHDRTWPGMAAACDAANSPRPEPADPSGAATGGGGGEATPLPAERGSGADEPAVENPKYAENHAFQQTTDVPEEQLCRGREHAQRINLILGPVAPQDRADAERVRALLAEHGYEASAVHAAQAGDAAVAWNVFVPGAGPCISGNTDPGGGIEVHGVFMEGGCTEPAGGH